MRQVRLCRFLVSLYLDNLGKLFDPAKSYVILYAYDILIMSPFVTYLELLHLCENELNRLDMAINFEKSCCLRVDPRCGIECTAITSTNCHKLTWITEPRYLGVYFVKFRILKCSLDAAKRGFYRAVI